MYLYTHVSLNAPENRDMTNFDEEESVWCDVKLTENDRLLIGCIYRSPNSSISNDVKINKALIHANNICFSHVLIMGDFNHPSINWYDSTSPPDVDHPSTRFLEAVRDSFMSQHVTEPTHYRGNCTPNVPATYLKIIRDVTRQEEESDTAGKEGYGKKTDGSKIGGDMGQDGERRKTYSAAVIEGFKRNSAIYVGDSIVRKTDSRLNKGEDVVVCLPGARIEHVTARVEKIMGRGKGGPYWYTSGRITRIRKGPQL